VSVRFAAYPALSMHLHVTGANGGAQHLARHKGPENDGVAYRLKRLRKLYIVRIHLRCKRGLGTSLCGVTKMPEVGYPPRNNGEARPSLQPLRVPIHTRQHSFSTSYSAHGCVLL
jgi:hypothetical protein